MLKEISIEELKPGMFVHNVLEQTGQLKVRSQGLVKSDAAVKMLKDKGILKLEIDLSKSQIEAATPPQEEEQKPKAKVLSDSDAMNSANDLYMQSAVIQGEFFDKIRTGQPADLQAIQDMSQDIIDAVFDNADAICCLTLIKNADEYLLEHALNCSILMAMFARNMGFDKELIEELSLAGLLFDTGMATIPEDILKKADTLSKQEWNIIKTHVDIGIEMVEQTGEVSDTVLDVITNHHERMQGNGYPEGKTGDAISTYGRMIAIVDSYDALTSDRPYRAALSPTAALKTLLSDTQYDASLVQQFIKCLGVHPVGSLVKLKSGKLAIVTKANKEDPLSPQVMCFYSVKSGSYREITKLDLSKLDDEIVSSVKPNDFKINLSKFFREIFLGSL